MTGIRALAPRMIGRQAQLDELDEHLHDLGLVVDHQHARGRRRGRIRRHPVSHEEALELLDGDPRVPAGRFER